MELITVMLRFLVRNLARTEMLPFLKRVVNYKIWIKTYLLEGSVSTLYLPVQPMSQRPAWRDPV